MAKDDIVRRAVDLIKAGRKAEARNLLQDVLRMDPTHIGALSAMARAADNNTEAMAALERVLEVAPDDAWAQRHLERLRRGSKTDMDDHPSTKRKSVSDDWTTAATGPDLPKAGSPETMPMPAVKRDDTQNPAVTGPLGPPQAEKSRPRWPLYVGGGCLLLSLCLCTTLIIGAVLFGDVGQGIAESIIEEQMATLGIGTPALTITPMFEEEPTATLTPTPEAYSDGREVTFEGSIALGDTVEGDLADSNGAHEYTITLPAETNIVIDALAAPDATTDPQIALLRPDRTLIDFDDDGGEGSNARLEAAIFEEGAYIIRVTVFGESTGGYALTVTEPLAIDDTYEDGLVTTSEEAITLSTPTEATLADETSAHNWLFDVGQQSSFTITVTAADSDALDPRIAVYGENDELLAFDDDGGEGRNSRVQIEVQPGQVLTLRVSAFTGAGAYTITVEPSNP